MKNEVEKYPSTLTNLNKSSYTNTAKLLIDEATPEERERIAFVINIGIIAGQKSAEHYAKRFLKERMVDRYMAWLEA